MTIKNQELFRHELPLLGINPMAHKSDSNALLDIALFRPQVLLMNIISHKLDFLNLVNFLNNKQGFKMRFLAMRSNDSSNDKVGFTLQEIEVFLIPKHMDELKKYYKSETTVCCVINLYSETNYIK